MAYKKGSFGHGKGLEHVFYNGRKWRIQSCGKYYYCNKKEHLLHRNVWIDNYGPIPDGYVIHHKDHNWRNNDISNLEMIDKKSHGKLHAYSSVESRIYKTIKCPICDEDFKTWRAQFCSQKCYKRGIKVRVFLDI